MCATASRSNCGSTASTAPGCKGHVDSLSPASGLEFALLPPDNATGNFTKIVQRVPVKIVLDDHSLTGLLRPGMSAEPTVDTKATVVAEREHQPDAARSHGRTARSVQQASSSPLDNPSHFTDYRRTLMHRPAARGHP